MKLTIETVPNTVEEEVATGGLLRLRIAVEGTLPGQNKEIAAVDEPICCEPCALGRALDMISKALVPDEVVKAFEQVRDETFRKIEAGEFKPGEMRVVKVKVEEVLPGDEWKTEGGE